MFVLHGTQLAQHGVLSKISNADAIAPTEQRLIVRCLW